MTGINMDAEDDTEGKSTLTTSVPAEDSTNAAWPDSRFAILMGRVARSEVPARRYWLRFLDAPLAKEFHASGAFDLEALAGAVPMILRQEPNSKLRHQSNTDLNASWIVTISDGLYPQAALI
jgi:hypothetical protein